MNSDFKTTVRDAARTAWQQVLDKHATFDALGVHYFMVAVESTSQFDAALNDVHVEHTVTFRPQGDEPVFVDFEPKFDSRPAGVYRTTQIDVDEVFGVRLSGTRQSKAGKDVGHVGATLVGSVDNARRER